MTSICSKSRLSDKPIIECPMKISVRCLHWLLFIGLTTLAASTGVAQNTQPSASQLPAELETRFLNQMRRTCELESSLRGVRVLDITLLDGVLLLEGLVDQESQDREVQQEAESIVQSFPDLRELVPKGVSVERMQPFPIRSEHLPALQAELASGQFIIPGLQPMLRQTRLIDAYYDERGGLVMSGLCINQAAYHKMQASPDLAELPHRQIIIQLEDLLAQRLGPGPYRRLRLADNRVEIQFRPDPVPILQQRVTEHPELDGVLIESAYYDDQGIFRLDGYLAVDSQRERLAEFVVQHLPDPEVLRSSNELDQAVELLNKFPLDEWQAEFQRQLAAAADPQLQKSCLTRSLFLSPGELQIHLGTIGLEEDAPDIHAAILKVAEEVTRKLSTENRLIADGIKNVSMGDLARWADPTQSLQAVVATQAKFDGLRVDGVRFDATKDLALVGVIEDQEQAAAITEYLSNVPAISQSPLAQFPVSCGSLKTVELSRMLGQLRTWTSENMDEMFLERLYFDEASQLHLSGVCISIDDATELEQHFANVVRQHASAELLLAKQPDGTVAAPVTELKQVSPSLTQMLRQLITETDELKGMSIARGYYAPDGQFVVSGVQNNDRQAEQLKQLVDELLTRPEWKQRLAAGLKLDEFHTVPLTELLACLQDIMPAFPVFDGIVFTEAFHDEMDRLAFRGTTTLVDHSEALDALKTLLESEPSWKLRLSAGVTLDTLTPRPRARGNNPDAARTAIQRIRSGDYETALTQLTLVIRESRFDSLAWYLRSICHAQLGNDFLAHRDIYRAAMIEQTGQAAFRARLRGLERFVDPMRRDADERLSQAKRELDTRVPPLELFGVRAWQEAQQAAQENE